MLTTQKSLCHAECCCMVNVVLLHPIGNLSVSRNGRQPLLTCLETSTAAFASADQVLDCDQDRADALHLGANLVVVPPR
jgi:hypothetical protein